MIEFTRDDMYQLARNRGDCIEDTALQAGVRGQLDTSIVYHSVDEVAARLSITLPELYRQVADGEIMAERWGSTLFFHPDELRRHAEEI